MRSDLVVLPEPNIDSDLGLPCGVEPFSVEDFFSQGAVKAFVVSIFPRTACQRTMHTRCVPMCYKMWAKCVKTNNHLMPRFVKTFANQFG